MPTWTDCFDSIVIGRVKRRWERSRQSWDDDLAVAAMATIRGPRTGGEALVYCYTFLNHHAGAARQAFELCPDDSVAADECVLIDYGCGPASALMGLAEAHFIATQEPLRVHYLGIEVPGSASVEIAREMFECIKDEDLITNDSTCQFSEFGREYPWAPAAADAPVFFALSYVLAHPYYDLPVQLPGRIPPRDPVMNVHDDIIACREWYGRPVHVVYSNATFHEERPVHFAWSRLLQALHLPRNVRRRHFDFNFFGSSRINGRGNIAEWRQRQFRFPTQVANKATECDYQIVV